MGHIQSPDTKLGFSIISFLSDARKHRAFDEVQKQ